MGFFAPLGLLLGLSLAALIAINLRARSRPLVEVSSLELFADTPAPVAQSRLLRLDIFFWLEFGCLAALTLVAAGLFLRMNRPIVRAGRKALIFDLGAAMGARGGGDSRLDAARREALAMIHAAPANEQFSVIGYARTAIVASAATARRDTLQQALASLRPAAVAVRAAALREALLEARGVDAVELFTDHYVSPQELKDGANLTPVRLHPIGTALPNLAIVSLEPGRPKSSEGRCLLRNFSAQPQTCELKIDAAGREVFHSTLMMEPRAEVMVRFGPLTSGGLVHARIVQPDALDADNDRYALAPQVKTRHALLVSPDRAVRDDLARVLLAAEPSYQITAIDSAVVPAEQWPKEQFDLAIVHDASLAGVHADARLLIFPENSRARGLGDADLRVTRSVAMAELLSREDGAPLATPVLLGPSRVLELPPWMTVLSDGRAVADPAEYPLAAVGRTPAGVLGVIAFDVRSHLLLNPDHLQALLLVIDTIRRVTAPRSPRIVATGEPVEVATFGPANLTDPDGERRTLYPDQRGIVRFTPLEAGRLTVSVRDQPPVEFYANYYDAVESDLSLAVAPPSSPRLTAPPAPARFTSTAVSEATSLTLLALLLLLAESALLVQRERRASVENV